MFTAENTKKNKHGVVYSFLKTAFFLLFVVVMQWCTTRWGQTPVFELIHDRNPYNRLKLTVSFELLFCRTDSVWFTAVPHPLT